MSREEKETLYDLVQSIFSDLENCPKHFSRDVSRPRLLTSVLSKSLLPHQHDLIRRDYISSSNPRLAASAMMAKMLVSPIKERFILKETCDVVSKGNNPP